MVDIFINSGRAELAGLNVTECCRTFGVSRTGYYSWKNRKKKEAEEAEKARKEHRLTPREEDYERILGVIRVKKYVPGRREMRTALKRIYGVVIGEHRIEKLMKEMGLVAWRPMKDAYKNQATHDHEAMAPDNVLGRRFYLGPRRVVLTDITYLYYGECRQVCYLCTFKDSFTKEILGWAVRGQMTVKLVVDAYQMMMDRHGSEFPRGEKTPVLLHSDQGSQYLSTTFERILTDDGFVHSVSDRGNCQDNAPQESFFGQTKGRIGGLIQRCRDLETVRDLINGYMTSYNEEDYQYSLAGLTPKEYYHYAMTGIYPLDDYFGVSSDRLRTFEEILADRRRMADQKNEKARRAAAERAKKNENRKKGPRQRMEADKELVVRRMEKCISFRGELDVRIQELKSITADIDQAIAWYNTLSEEKRSELMDIRHWKDFPELSYVRAMNGMF